MPSNWNWSFDEWDEYEYEYETQDEWDAYEYETQVVLIFPPWLSRRQQDWLEETALRLVRECPVDEIADEMNVQDLIWQLHDAGPSAVDAIIAEAEQIGLDPLTVLLQMFAKDRRNLQAIEEGEAIEAQLR